MPKDKKILPLERFISSNSLEVEQKLQSFRTAGVDRIHYLFDFDRTLTTSSHIGKDVTIWDLLDELLPSESRKAYDHLTLTYKNKESTGKLSDEDARAWWALSFGHYIDYGVNLNEAKHALGKLKIRSGSIELFNLCETSGIPTIILSAGIGNIIEIIAHEHGLRPTIILSTKLHLAKDGRITGWDPESLVHILNKHEKGHGQLSRMTKQRPYTILVGDSLEDARMITGGENVLRIRVSDRHRIDAIGTERYLLESFAAGFDLVLDEDLTPLVRLTELLIQSPEHARTSSHSPLFRPR